MLPTSPPSESVEAALAAYEQAQERRIPTLQRVRYTHDAMIDLVIINPGISQNEIAEYFGYSVGWVSIVFNSDAFQARLAQRKGELVDPSITASVRERFSALAHRSLEVLQDKLNQPSLKVPDNLALRAAELAAKALGEGGHAPAAPPEAHLSNLAARLLALGARQPATLEYIDVEVPNQARPAPSEPSPARSSHASGEAGPPGSDPPDGGGADATSVSYRPVGGQSGGENSSPPLIP